MTNGESVRLVAPPVLDALRQQAKTMLAQRRGKPLQEQPPSLGLSGYDLPPEADGPRHSRCVR